MRVARILTSAPGVVAALTFLIAPAMQAGTMGVNGSISVSGSVPYVSCTPDAEGTFNPSASAPGDGALAFSQTVSGSTSGYFDSHCTVSASASGTFSGLVAGNTVSLSGDVSGALGDANGSGQLTAYDTLTFQEGTYELTEIVSSNVDFQSCDGHQATDGGVSGIGSLPTVGFGCQSVFIGSGTEEFQSVFTIGQYSPRTNTLAITADDFLADYPNESASASITVTVYLDALSGSYTSASGTDYATPADTPEPGTITLMTVSLLLLAARLDPVMRQISSRREGRILSGRGADPV